MSIIGDRISTQSVGLQLPYYKLRGNTLELHGDDLTIFNVGSTTLNSIDFSQGNIRVLGSYALSGSKITSISFPQGLVTLGNSAFYNCTSLTSVTFPTSLRTVQSGVFGSCTALVSLQYPEGVTSIGQVPCSNCTSLQSISFPTTLRSFNGGFSGLTNCPLIDMSMTKITTIPTYFITMTCTGIQEIKFPSTVTLMKSNPGFGYCANLTKLTFLSPTPFSLPSSSTIPSQVTNIYVPAASVDAYKTATNWSNYASIISAIPT